jgi:hypothetical protein
MAVHALLFEATQWCGTLSSLQQMVALTSLTLICVLFALSCFCCTVMFIDAERSRMKEGVTFQAKRQRRA